MYTYAQMDLQEGSFRWKAHLKEPFQEWRRDTAHWQIPSRKRYFPPPEVLPPTHSALSFYTTDSGLFHRNGATTCYRWDLETHDVLALHGPCSPSVASWGVCKLKSKRVLMSVSVTSRKDLQLTKKVEQTFWSYSTYWSGNKSFLIRGWLHLSFSY